MTFIFGGVFMAVANSLLSTSERANESPFTAVIDAVPRWTVEYAPWPRHPSSPDTACFSFSELAGSPKCGRPSTNRWAWSTQSRSFTRRWSADARHARSAFRNSYVLRDRYGTLGFRLARSAR